MVEEEHCVPVTLRAAQCRVLLQRPSSVKATGAARECPREHFYLLLSAVYTRVHSSHEDQNAQSQPLSCSSDINLMRRMRKHQHQRAVKRESFEQVAAIMCHIYSVEIFGLMKLDEYK